MTSETKKRRQYAPGWRTAGTAVDARMRRSERGFKRGERVVGIWDEVKGQPGLWVRAREGSEPFAFLIASVALADTQKADRAKLAERDPELVKQKGGREKPTSREKTERAKRAGSAGGRPAASALERREVYPVRLPAWVISDLAEEADRREEKPRTLAADIVSSWAVDRRKALGLAIPRADD